MIPKLKFSSVSNSCFKKLKKVLAVTSQNVNIISQTEDYNKATTQPRRIKHDSAQERGLGICPLAVISFSNREMNKTTN